MIHDPNRSNLTIVLFAVVAVLGVTVTAGGALATPGHASAHAQATGTQSVSASDVASWDWWDDDEDEDDEQEDDSEDDSPWWEDDDPWWEDDDEDEDEDDEQEDDSGDDSPWWEDDDPWWEDDDDSDDGDDGDSGDGEDGTDQPAPADFGVSVSGTNSPVTEGDTLSVTATVENTGGQTATQTVDFSVGSVSDSQSVTLDADESQSVTFEWTTDEDDAGSYTATVESANDSATTSVSVEASEPEPDPEPEPADFGVSVSSTNSPVTEGETITVDATVENTGGQQATQTVVLDIDGSTVDSQSVTLGAGESEMVSLSWTTAAGDAGDSTATVSTADASAQTTVTVEAPAPDPDPASFGVSVSSTNSPVTAGEPLDVTTTITNDGEQSGTQTIELDVAGGVQDSESVSLGAGESETITLSWATAEGDGGDYAATVSSVDASAQTDVTVESATTIPSSFTTVVEDGEIELGTGSNAYTINLTECPNGEAPSSDVQCQTATATVDSESGDFTIASEDLNFDTSVNVGSGIGDVAVQMGAPNGLTGTADWESGDVTLNGELNVSAPEFGGSCGASTTISATTGTEDSLSGSTFNVSDGSPAEGTLVDSTYSVPAVSGCPTDYSLIGININTLANSQLGLPSESGNNRLVMDLHMEYDE